MVENNIFIIFSFLVLGLYWLRTNSIRKRLTKKYDDVLKRLAEMKASNAWAADKINVFEAISRERKHNIEILSYRHESLPNDIEATRKSIDSLLEYLNLEQKEKLKTLSQNVQYQANVLETTKRKRSKKKSA